MNRRRWTRRLALGVLATAVVGVAWLAVTGLLARAELNSVRAQLTVVQNDLKTGDYAGARMAAARVSRHADRAHALTSGPAWATAATIPGLGGPFEAARGVTASADALGRSTVPDLVDVYSAIDPAAMRFLDHRIDLSTLIARTPALDGIARAASAQQQRVTDLPHHTWLAPMNSAVGRLQASLTTLNASLDTVDRAAHIAPVMLGYPVPQRYFVGFQNEAEARGTGGLPGAFGIVVADHGTLSFTHFGSDGELVGVDSGVSLGTDFDRQWSDFQPTRQYLNSTVSPNFPDAARIWAGMWQRKSGQHIDGAVSLDPSALSYLLKVTGPALLPDGTTVDAKNVVALTQSTVYTRFTDQGRRKAYLLQVAKAADERVLGGFGDPGALARAATRAAHERRLLVWSSDASTEALFNRLDVGGTVPVTSAPFIGPVVVNFGANKLDYYLDRSVDWRATGCGAVRDVTVTVTLRNNAPATGLPSYVTQRTDRHATTVKPGDNRVLFQYLGTTGGSLRGATLDGRAVGVSFGTAQGHPSWSLRIELPRGTTQTLVLRLNEPAAAGPPVRLVQPLIRPISFSTESPTCPR